ncbi:MAG: hypothetical protein GF392_02355 [Candidatus Omnitrophica bacterium]|nr:hypothetical protein [Candidatus Omnitrophota bacterium]
MLKRILLICLLFSIPPLMSAVPLEPEMVDSDEGQQVIFTPEKRLTVFSDQAVTVGHPVCVYLDSSLLESEGYNLLEWYYLEKIDKHYLEIRISKARLLLPAYILRDETSRIVSVPLSGLTTSVGTYRVHGVKIRITVEDEEKAGVEAVAL